MKEENVEDSNPNLDISIDDYKTLEPENPDNGGNNGKPLSISRVRLEKVRFPKLDAIIKDFNKIVKDAGSCVPAALKEIERVQADASKQIEKRFNESSKRLNRIKDNNKRNELAKKLTTEVDKANASIKNFLDQQKVTIGKLMTGGDLYKDGMELIEKAQQYRKLIVEKLTLMGSIISSTIQSSFAKAGTVMDEIATK